MVCWRDEATDPLPNGTYTSVEVGEYDTCAIRDTGEILCANSRHGQPPEGTYKAVSVGPHHSCAIHVGGTVVCWGADGFGQATPPPGTFSALVARDVYTCGLRTDGELSCWGLKDDKYCYGGDFECAGWGRKPLPKGPFTTIAASPAILHYYSYPFGYPQPICAVRPDGSFVCVHGGNDSPKPPAGLFRSIDSSQYGTCAIGAESEIACWGSGASGWSVPDGPFDSVSVGNYHACGLRLDGKAECWGWELHGETEAPEGEFVAVDAGVLLSCGLRPNGDAECWGYSEWWLDSPPPGPYTAVSAGDGSACGVRVGGELDCWGRRREGPIPDGPFTGFSLNDHACGLRPSGKLVCADKPLNRNDYTFYNPEYSVFVADVADHAPGGTFATFSGWGSFACGLRHDGTVDCWDSVDEWKGVSPAGRFTAVSAASGSACGIRADRTIECWSAWNSPGWGIPDPVADEAAHAEIPATATTTTTTEPAEEPSRGVPYGVDWVREDPPAGPFTAIDSGEHHTCAITITGGAYCWGPTAGTARGGPFTAVRIGGRHYCEPFEYPCAPIVCGVRPDGAPHCWWLDDDRYNRPLSENLPPSTEPVAELDVGFGVCAAPIAGGIACTQAHSHSASFDRAEVPDGEYVRVSVGYGWNWPPPYDGPGWGAGNSDAAGAPMPDSRHQHACALRADGEIVCWGDKRRGKSMAPPPWLDFGPYRDVAAGMRHSCALGRTGEAICWGDNEFGQTDAPGGAFERISAGMWHTCGLRPDGSIACWGNGPAGYSSNQYDEPPLDAPADPPDGPFTEVAAGQWHTCALRPDGSIACWYSY